MISQEQRNLEEKISKEGLVPDPKHVGEFIKPKYRGTIDKFRFLAHDNWVYHDSIVKHVLEGDYLGITPYSGEFVPTMNCTNRCNIPCSYCEQRALEGITDFNDFKNARTHMQSLEFSFDLLYQLKEAGLKGLIFTGGGEPMLFDGIDSLIKKTTDYGIDSVLYTNGNLYTESESLKKIEKLFLARPKLIRVSLNAGTEKVYNAFHRPLSQEGAFKRALRTIENLAKCSVQDPRVKVGVAVVINNINCDDVVESALRIREIVSKTGGGISFATYRPAFDYYHGKQLPPELLLKACDTVETKVREILESSGVKLANVTSRYEDLLTPKRGYKQCRAMGVYSELSPSGELHTCCDRNCNRNYVIGDLTRDSLRAIYNSEKRFRQVKLVNDFDCSTCPPACKPHNVNKQFEEIEVLRAKNELYKFSVWLSEIRKNPKPEMVNF